jgi:hypothetical protein
MMLGKSLGEQTKGYAPRVGVAVILLEPFSLWLHQQENPSSGNQSLISVQSGRVAAVSPVAQARGILLGMKTLAAQQIDPQVQVLQQESPELLGRWVETLEGLYGYADRLEPAGFGRAYLRVTEGIAREIAYAYQARVGWAGSREVALFAALTTPVGSVKAVINPGESQWMRGLPAALLAAVGLEPKTLERLNFLGVRSLGQVMDWKVSQRRSYFGKQFKMLEPYLGGAKSDRVALYTPQRSLEARFEFWETVHEPHQIEPVLHKLCQQLEGDLGEFRAMRLGVRAVVGLGILEAWRAGKKPLREAQTLLTLARLALEDTRASELGLEQITVVLSGIARHFTQERLFAVKPGRSVAVEALEERFPEALLKVRWLQPKSHAVDHAFQWVVCSSGVVIPMGIPMGIPVSKSKVSLEPVGVQQDEQDGLNHENPTRAIEGAVQSQRGRFTAPITESEIRADLFTVESSGSVALELPVVGR